MSGAQQNSTAPKWRNAAIAKIQIARKRFGLGESDYRGLISGVCPGKTSASELNAEELAAVLDEFKRRGFVEGNSFTKNLSDFDEAEPQAKLIRCLWNDCLAGGVLKNGSEKSLRHFIKRVGGTDNIRWLTPQAANKVIEALKAMRTRSRRSAPAE
jgi:phage gp16-like protein